MPAGGRAGGQTNMMKKTIAFRLLRTRLKTVNFTVPLWEPPVQSIMLISFLGRPYEFMICTPTIHHILLR